MAQASTQNFANHGRIDPWFHFVLVPILAITFVGQVVVAVRYPSIHTAWLAIFYGALLGMAFKMRLYALKVQTRVIRLEERLRLATLLQEPSRSRIGELTEAQLVGLRFASDTEVAALAALALEKNLSNKEIKQQVKNWRADEWRV